MRLQRGMWMSLAGQALLLSTLSGAFLVWNVHDGYNAERSRLDRERLAAFGALASEAARAGRPLDQLIAELDLRDPDGLGGRVVLIAPNGARIAGPEGGTARAEQAIESNGAVIATARIVREPRYTQADRSFLARQYIGIAVALGSAFLIALFLASLFARRWARPQQELLAFSRAIVEGQEADGWDIEGPTETVQTARNLQRVAGRFERLETARRTWLVSTAEELRRPSGAIGERIEMLAALDPPIDPEYIDSFRADQADLVRLADDLQAVALADLGRLPVAFHPVDPRALIHNAIYSSKKRAEAHGVTLETSNLPQYTILVKWDGARIEQLFAALIDNSLRYTPRGGRIVLGLEPHGETWELLIDDSAPGIDVDMAQRLFEPFYRTADARDRSVTGSGLGLATARAIVDAHHGRIEAGRSPIGGLRVSVRLPASQPMA